MSAGMVSAAAGIEIGSAITSTQLITSQPGICDGEPAGERIADRGRRRRRRTAAGRRPTSAPPPWRRANAITSAAPATEAIQNSGLGRSWVMATATSAVAIGSMPSTTPPCEASTRLHRRATSGAETGWLTQSIAIASCGHSARRQRPAQHDQQRQRAQPGDRGAQRRSVQSDRSARPRSASPAACRRRSPCRRSPAADRDVRATKGSVMTRVVSGFAARAYSNLLGAHGGHARLPRTQCCSTPVRRRTETAAPARRRRNSGRSGRDRSACRAGRRSACRASPAAPARNDVQLDEAGGDLQAAARRRARCR